MVVGTGLAVLLGCGGLLDTSPSASDDAPEDASPADLAPPLLLVLSPVKEQCAWSLHSPRTGTTELRWTMEGGCPEEVLWAPDGKQIIAIDENGVWSIPWGSDGSREAVPMPQENGSRHGPWRTEDGLRVAHTIMAKVRDKGARQVFRAGDRRVAIWNDREAHYGVRGTKVVPPGKGERDVWLPPWGATALVVFHDRGEDGTWTETAVFPTRCDAGDTPGIDVGGPLVEHAPPPSWTDLRMTCASGMDCYAPEALAERADLVQAVAAEDEMDAVGFVPSGAADGGGWLFLVVFGDTPHAHGPVLWCADVDCAEPVPLEGVPDRQLTLDVRDGLLLVAEEYSNASPQIFPAGASAPTASWPEGVGAWLPNGGLPGLP